jgi:hypothetical protein
MALRLGAGDVVEPDVVALERVAAIVAHRVAPTQDVRSSPVLMDTAGVPNCGRFATEGLPGWSQSCYWLLDGYPEEDAAGAKRRRVRGSTCYD